jgi:hypothetical protein
VKDHIVAIVANGRIAQKQLDELNRAPKRDR